ncbi:excalibur calcium-binding domain-containing protein [Streptomyces sp. NPDC007172]
MTAPVPPPPMDGGGNKGGSDVYYKNCTAARAAGVTPLHRGDPGYAPRLDRDGDGIACER